MLVTGGAGYIGSIAVRSLVESGAEVVVLDTLERGWREAVHPDAELVEGSVGDAELVCDVVDGCDVVMHFAGLIDVAESEREPERYHRVNADEPVALLEAMAARGVDALVFSSTAAVYGEPARVPIREEDAVRPVNAYGASKLAFERAIEERARHGLRAIRFRYFNVAGAWEDGSLGEAHVPETHLIPRILCAMRDGERTFEVFGGDYPTRDGTCVRDYIHVRDLVDAHLLGVERLLAGMEGGVYNLGNGEGFTNREVVLACARVTGVPVSIEIGPRRPGDPAVLIASAERAERELGWRRQRPSLEQMIEDAWRWHLARPGGYR